MENLFSYYPSFNDDLQRLFGPRMPSDNGATWSDQLPQFNQESDTEFHQNGIDKDLSSSGELDLPHPVGSWGAASQSSLWTNYPSLSGPGCSSYGGNAYSPFGGASRAPGYPSAFSAVGAGITGASSLLGGNGGYMRRALAMAVGNETVNNQQMRQQQQQRPKRKTFSECVFCRNNGEPPTWYRSHSLRDGTGRVTCPVLRAYTCPICGTSGDDSHTIKYCPRNRSNELALKSMGMVSGVFAARRKSQ